MREIAKNEKPQGLKENIKVAKRGSKASLLAKEYFENETHKKAVTSENNIGLRYVNDVEKIEKK